jgi:FtsP/CotA-like multicopper oxidase with cupredoxin domain
MGTTRRQFIGIAAATTAATMFPSRSASAFYNSPTGSAGIPLFGTPLRGAGPGGIPVAAADGTPAPVTGVTHYTVAVRQFQDAGVVPTLGPTTLWGYHPVNPLGGSQPQKHLGGIIVAQKGQAIQLTCRNELNVAGHILPNDLTIPGANQAVDRVAVHLHGGLVPWISDGGPHDWFDPRGLHGLSFLNNGLLNPGAAANEAEYYYPNNQTARLMWYHDHAFGITRLNAYAGVATAYLLRDAFEIGLKNLGLPEFIENSVLGSTPVVELPLAIQDKVFVGSHIHSSDPTWTGPTDPGSLWYAHTYDRPRDMMRGGRGGTMAAPDPSVVPQFFGDTMLVNGTAYPAATVEARRYRLRILNACNSRFLNLQLYVADGSRMGIRLDPLTGAPANAPFVDGAQGTAAVLQIGTEGGFLPRPVRVATNVPYQRSTGAGSLIIAPGERADVLLDFSRYAGKRIVVYNDAPAPFPMGDARNDYFPGVNVGANPINGLTTPGFGPNSRVLMRFDVVAATSVDRPLAITTATDLSAGIDPLLVPVGVTTPPPGVPVRTLTLNETIDGYGRSTQMLGQPYLNPPSETPLAGTTEVWDVFNMTPDAHPIHFHFVNVQIVSRQGGMGGGMRGGMGTAPPVAPDPNERGWKETVRMLPMTTTRVIAKFDLAGAAIRTAAGAVIPTPASPRTGGHEYVWHCHILEHEEHDMMRPLVVI